MNADLRQIGEPDGIALARTLPAEWYSSNAHHEAELACIWRNEWICVGDVTDMPVAGTWKALLVGELPVLLVRDREGVLRGFLDVCRHRAAPLCDVGGSGSGAALSCPYHAWLYRLDGSLARAQGVGAPEDFDVADYSLKPVLVAVYRRWVWIHADQNAPPLDLGPLGAAIDAFGIEAMDVVLAESDERSFNWKVLLENYSENYHTPFVHPEIDTSLTHDYPMVSDGLVLYAWDRPLHPTDDAGRVMASLLPGEPGWEVLAAVNDDAPYAIGSYLTVYWQPQRNKASSGSTNTCAEPVVIVCTHV